MKFLAFALTVMLCSAAKADKCPFYAYSMKPGTAGASTPNVLPAGDDILFSSRCSNELCGWTAELTLSDERMTQIPVTFDSVEASYYWRVHPAMALMPGTYTLRIAGTKDHNQGERCDEQVYVFRVEGEASQAPEYVISLGAETYDLGNGEIFHCAFWPADDVANDIYVNFRPCRSLDIKASNPITQAQSLAFLRRIRVTKGPGAGSAAPFSVVPEHYYTSDIKLNDQMQNICVVLETLQVNTLQVTSAKEQCFSYVSDGSPYEPAPFAECNMGSRIRYGRAWCDANRAACSASNPRFAEPSVSKACEPYADLCAPLLGERAEAEGVCK